MSAVGDKLTAYVHDMDRLGVPPFRSHPCPGLTALASDIRQAALAEDATAIAAHIKTTRLVRLWRVEDWLILRKQRHPRRAKWLHIQLVQAGWRKGKP